MGAHPLCLARCHRCLHSLSHLVLDMPPKAADKKKGGKEGKAEAAPSPPIPDEWRNTVKGIVWEPEMAPSMWIGTRIRGRVNASPYNWPATNAEPCHNRKGEAWEKGGALYNYSHGIETP